MPTLNFRTEPAVLTRSGPLVPAILAVSDAHRQILARQGEPVPDTIGGFALIDTGASSTCVDQEAATIGRDLLQTAVLVYNGMEGTTSLSL